MKNIKNKSWYMKYIPNNIDEYLFENTEHKNTITKFINDKDIDGNLILSGPPGTGKTSLVRILVNVLLEKKEYNLIESPKPIEDFRNNVVPKLSFMPKGNDKKKIILLNEFQTKLYSPEMINLLKDECLESYQNNNTFIATTNHINQLPEAILERFNWKLLFTGKQEINNYAFLTMRIFKSENIVFEKEDVLKFIQNNIGLSLRTFVTELQLRCYTGKFQNLNTYSYSSTGSPDEIIELTITIFRKIIDINDPNGKKLTQILPLNTPISNEYQRIIEITSNNELLDYEYIFSNLSNKLNDIIPLKIETDNYLNITSLRRFKFVNFLSYLSDCFKILNEMIELDCVSKKILNEILNE